MSTSPARQDALDEWTCRPYDESALHDVAI